MYKMFALTLFVLCSSAIVRAQDPVKVDADHYKVEFENAQVRVLRVKYGPHEKSVMHKHPNAIAVFLTDANGQFSFPKGPVQPINAKAGTVIWTPATVHLPENIGDQPFEVIVIELKSPPRKKPASKPAATTSTTTTTK